MEARIITNEVLLNDLLELLRENKLPYEDIRLKDNLFVSYHDEKGEHIGSGGLEFYSNYALLRSIAVDKTFRGRSVGQKIVEDLLARAKEKLIHEVYLLTETARDFFLKRGFADIDRDKVPAPVKMSAEFSSACPVSAAAMVYRIKRDQT